MSAIPRPFTLLGVSFGRFADGSAAAPSISFASSPTNGFWYQGSNFIGVACGGAQSFLFGPGGALYGPDSVTRLSLTAGGAIQLVAGGTNQNISLTPNGTGWTTCYGAQAKATAATQTVLYLASNEANAVALGFSYVGSATPANRRFQIDSYDNAVGAIPLVLNQNGGLVLVGTTTDSSNGRIQLATHTAVTGGIGFGTDCALFRNAAGLQMDFGTGGWGLTLAGTVSGGDNALLVLYNKGAVASSAGVLTFTQNNTTPAQRTAAEISGYLSTATAGSEVGAMVLRTRTVGGVLTTCLSLNGVQDTIAAKFFQHGGSKRTTSTFTKTSDTTLADVTGLSVAVAASSLYRFRAILHITCNVAGGAKAAIASSGSVTTIRYTGYSLAAAGVGAVSTSTSSGTAVAGATAVVVIIVIEGYINTNAAGNLTVQFAQNASFGTGSSVDIGSTLEVELTP